MLLTLLNPSGSFSFISIQEVDRLEQLQSKLHSYTSYLPKVPRQLLFHQDSWEEEEEVANLGLEDSWQTLLDNSEVQVVSHRP